MSRLFCTRTYITQVLFSRNLKGKGLNVLLVLLVVIGLLIYAKRKPREHFHYMGEIFADQAGYYVYLPAAFIYDFDGSGFSEEFIKSVGYGFSVDSVSGKIVTKYAIGVALMQAPFFLVTHGYTAVSGGQLDGFSGNYHNVPNWASWFYASMGLWLFYLFLIERVQKWVAWLSVLVVFFGTSTYFYAADNTGMSHVYSFFLFSFFIYIFNKACSHDLRWKSALLLGLISGLIVAVRPVNVLFIAMAVPYLLLLNGKRRSWILRQLSFTNMAILILAGFIMIVPQLLYWKLISGSFIHYSYGNEGFIYWKNPKLLEFWFAPLAGLFLYSPAYLLAVFALIRGIQKKQNAILLIGFIGFCYLMASWHVYFFGCSFGSRNLVEFSVLFFIPLTLWINKSKKVLQGFIASTLLISCAFTLTLMVSFGNCFYRMPLDWEAFKNLIGTGVYYQQTTNRVILPEQLYSGINCSAHKYFTINSFTTADVHVKIEGYSEKTEIALEVYKDSIMQFSSFNVYQEGQRDEENEMYYSFLLPKQAPKDAVIKVYVVNTAGDSIYMDKLAVWLR